MQTVSDSLALRRAVLVGKNRPTGTNQPVDTSPKRKRGQGPVLRDDASGLIGKHVRARPVFPFVVKYG